MAATAVADREWAPITDPRVAEPVFEALDKQAREWAGVIAAATAAFVDVVAEIDARKLMDQFDFRSLEHWVSLRCGVSVAHANRLVAIARGLRELPLLREQFAAGAVSEDQMLEVAKAGVTPFHDRDATDLASSMTVPQLRRALSFLPDVSSDTPADPAEPAASDDTATEPEQPGDGDAATTESGPGGSAEWIQFGDEGHGTWGLHLRLSTERGALIEKAIEAGRDREFNDRHDSAADPNDPPTDISNLDGFLRLVSDALDVADPATRRGKPPSDRFMVNIHLNADGSTNLHLGARLPASSRDELCCDTDIRAWLHYPDGSIGLGRRARVVSPRLRVVVEHRDGGCVVPGCGSRRHLRVHHIQHWLHGGRTDTDNLICLCPAHHKAVHRGQLTLAGSPDRGSIVVTDRRGRPYAVGSPTPPGDEQIAAVTRTATASPWRGGERPNWHWVVWNDPALATPSPPPPPPQPPRARARTFFDDYPGFQHLTPAWATPRRSRRSRDPDDDDDVTYG